MRIKTKLTFLFAIIVATILIIFSASIYVLSSNFRVNQFNSRLDNKALSTVTLLIAVEEVDRNILKIIDKNTAILPEEEVHIFNYLNQSIYSSIDKGTIEITPALLNRIRLEEKVRFTSGQKECVGMLYTDRFNRFVVVAAAYDKFGRGKMKNLRFVLIIGFISSIILTIFAGRFYSGGVLHPITKVINQVNSITASNLFSRVDIGKNKDEIAHLALTFNKMLERLENAFEVQKSFVSNASHELRTPLTALMGQIEVALMSKRNTLEYENVLNSALEEVKKMNNLSNGLLELAHASSDISKIVFSQLRIDELILFANSNLLKFHHDYKVLLDFSNIENENELLLFGNENLLKVAIINLMDNACKFSDDKTVQVCLQLQDTGLCIFFQDKGSGIPENEIPKIFQPFYRASNARKINGHGLGLSLVTKIVEIHKGKLEVNSELDVGTTISIIFPHSIHS